MPQGVGYGPEAKAKLEERLKVLHKRRAGAGVSMGGRKEREERLRLVEKDIGAVQDSLKSLNSLQGRVRERRTEEKKAGVERGK